MVSPIRVGLVAVATFATLVLTGCFTPDESPEGCEQGAEGCECFANQTCLTGLTCQDQTCIGDGASSGPTPTTTATMTSTSTSTSTSTAGGTTDTPPMTSTTTATTSTTTPTSTETSTTTNDPTGDETSSTGTSTSDTNGVLPCDPMGEECPPADKCNPWSDNGDDLWNAFGCFPIDPDAMDPGDECSIEDSQYSGIDNCAPGSVCLVQDAGGTNGICAPLCNPNGGTCTDPTQNCFALSQGFVGLCVPSCDPLLQDCPRNNGCYVSSDGAVAGCAPDASEAGGAADQACTDVNDCNPGLACVEADAFGLACAAEQCCAPICDPSSPNCQGGASCLDIPLPFTGICG